MDRKAIEVRLLVINVSRAGYSQLVALLRGKRLRPSRADLADESGFLVTVAVPLSEFDELFGQLIDAEVGSITVSNATSYRRQEG